MSTFTLEAMDGRKRGTILRNEKGQFTTIEGRNSTLQNQINEYFKKIKHYEKFVGENPDLEGLIDAEKRKIADCEKEMRLNKFSKRGIKDRLKAYEKAMKKQGLKGKQLDEQVARYKEGLLNQRQEHIDKLKGHKDFAQKGKTNVKPSGGGKWVKGLKKAGKWGAIAAAAVAVGAFVFNKCSGKDEKSEAVKPEEQATTPAPADETPDKPTIPATPAAPATPEEPQKSEGEIETIKAKYGDTYWGYAKRELISEHQGDAAYKPSNKEILERMYEVLERNGVKMAEDDIHSQPPLIVGDEVKLKKAA